MTKPARPLQAVIDRACKAAGIRYLIISESACADDVGCCYVIETERVAKIGFTKNIKQRQQHYNTHHQKIGTAFFGPRQEMREMERLCHAQLRDFRAPQTREWYDISSYDLQRIAYALQTTKGTARIEVSKIVHDYLTAKKAMEPDLKWHSTLYHLRKTVLQAAQEAFDTIAPMPELFNDPFMDAIRAMKLKKEQS